MAGIEPATPRLAVERSTYELHLETLGGFEPPPDEWHFAALSRLSYNVGAALRKGPGIQSRQSRLHRGSDHLHPLESNPQWPGLLDNRGSWIRSSIENRGRAHRCGCATKFQPRATFRKPRTGRRSECTGQSALGLREMSRVFGQKIALRLSGDKIVDEQA